VFVIPIIVREEEGVNPVNLLKRSASVLKRTWGETLIGYVGLAFANMMIVFGSLAVLAVVLFASIALSNYWLIAVVGALWLLTMFAWGYLTGVASKVYKAALYLYAAEGIVAEPYSSELLDMAWKYKKS
jgi:hypothetical protein